MNEPQEMNFEHLFARLEAILDRMNSGNVTLDESLRLYKEADQLIVTCSSHLNQAEATIETLIKSRNGQLALDSEGKPLLQEFQAQN